MIELGKINTLRIVKEVDFGLYLDGGSEGEILMPKRYVPANFKIDDYLDVFVYLDSEDRIIATSETPLAEVDQFALLKVKQLTQVGAFLEWGLMKDLLLPFREQKFELRPNQSVLVRVFLDKTSNRIVATTKLDRFLDNLPLELETNDEVDIIIWEKTNLGYKVIINNTYTGLLYENEIFQPVHPGMKLKGFIKLIRPDEKIDVTLQRSGMIHVDEVASKILDKLKLSGGFIEANDNTSPESIKHMFGVSKKAFKKAIGTLYKNKNIVIEERGIRLNKS
ncbi:MAG: GntR family transcriptional regulator [Crocinitomicaceae bacterium]|nr:GntR family transcriptional regulator [Crocinitomicaceae bacterium]